MRLPTRFPVCTVLGVLLGLSVLWVGVQGWQRFIATPDQAFYLRGYVRSFVPLPVTQTFATPAGRHRYKAAQFHEWLSHKVYRHSGSFQFSIFGLLGVFVIALAVGAGVDGKRRQELERGIQVSGRKVVRVRKLGKRAKDNWFAIAVQEREL